MRNGQGPVSLRARLGRGDWQSVVGPLGRNASGQSPSPHAMDEHTAAGVGKFPMAHLINHLAACGIGRLWFPGDWQASAGPFGHAAIGQSPEL